MKKICLTALIVLVSTGLAVSASAKKASVTPDKTYNNADFNFSLKYPAGWKYDEAEKPKVDREDLPFGMKTMPGMGKMCQVNFAEEPRLGKKSDEPNIDLNVMEIDYSKAKAQGRDEEKKTKKKKKYKAEKDDNAEKCVVIENKSIKWGGQNAHVITKRCPETAKVKIDGKKQKITAWRYTTMVNMNLVRAKEMYQLNGEMLCAVVGNEPCDNMSDKGLSVFNKDLKLVRNKMLTTTKFGRR